MKNFPILLFFLLSAGPAFGQVNFNLTYQPDSKVYTVSIVPEVSWVAPKNMVGSAQVVLRFPAAQDFTPHITSRVEGTVWSDNAYVDYPNEAPDWSFVCISLVSGPTAAISFAAGQEVPLFSFVNAGGCAELIELASNNDPVVQAVRTGGLNVTQHLAVVGARGNAFSGIVNGSIAVECAVSGSSEAGNKVVGAVQILPVPADEAVKVRWENICDRDERIDMIVFDQQSREVCREKVNSLKGENTHTLLVKNWKPGIYTLRFQSSAGRQTQGWNIVVIH